MTRRRHHLREVIPPGPSAATEADKALRRLANQVDERRNPRTNATLNQLLDQHFDMLDLEPNTVEAYRDLAANHIRPLIGIQNPNPRVAARHGWRKGDGCPADLR